MADQTWSGLAGRGRALPPRSLPLPGPDYSAAEFVQLIWICWGPTRFWDPTNAGLVACSSGAEVFAPRCALTTFRCSGCGMLRSAGSQGSSSSMLEPKLACHLYSRHPGRPHALACVEVPQRVAGRAGKAFAGSGRRQPALYLPTCTCLGPHGDSVLLSEDLLRRLADDDRLSLSEPALADCLLRWGVQRVAALHGCTDLACTAPHWPALPSGGSTGSSSGVSLRRCCSG